MTGRKSEKAITNELELEGKKLTDPTEIVEGFNKFFAKIGSQLSKTLILVSMNLSINQSRAPLVFNK